MVLRSHGMKSLAVPHIACFLCMLTPLTLLNAAAPTLAVEASDVPLGTPDKIEPWSPHPSATPVTSRDEGPQAKFHIKGNGTGICAGGWQFVFANVEEGRGYHFQAQVRHTGLDFPRDNLVAVVLWDQWAPSQKATGTRPWNYLLPKAVDNSTVELEATLKAPPGATHLTIRYLLRWSRRGTSTWTAPTVKKVDLPERNPVKICIVNVPKKSRRGPETRSLTEGTNLPDDIAERVDLWGNLVLKACQQAPQLIVMPEVVISGKDMVEGAITVPGPATRPFQRIAQAHDVFIVLGVREREADTIYNSAVLVSPQGKIAGVYRKVHLAVAEGFSGEMPGDSFPIFDTSIGRIGCLICMDTSVSESARMLGLGGVDIVCFPIMGDMRASRWTPGPPAFDESRWKAIMRTRAIDNQACMAVARNNVQGSCIIDRSGKIMAWNDGTRDMIFATLPAEDGYRLWNGGDFREVIFLLRRPHLYKTYSDASVLGPAGR
jgi:predicted amidohydrolase